MRTEWPLRSTRLLVLPAVREVDHRQVQKAVAAAHHPIVALSFNLEEDPARLGDPGNVAELEAQAPFQAVVVALALRLQARLIQSRPSKELIHKMAIHHSLRSINNNKVPSRLLSVARSSNKYSPTRTRPFPESRMEQLPRTRIVREGGVEVAPEEIRLDIISG